MLNYFKKLGRNIGENLQELEQSKEFLDKESEVAQSCPTLCNPMDCSLPGSTIHGIFQARILEWVAISFSILDKEDLNKLNFIKIKTSFHKRSC